MMTISAPLRACTFALALALGASAAHAQSIPPCVQPRLETPFEAYFLESANQIVAQVQRIAASAGDSFDFCFMDGPPNAYFFSLYPYPRSGIRFTIAGFNSVYRVSPRPEDAVLANLLILAHEMGHLFAHYLRRGNLLPQMARNPDEMLPFVVKPSFNRHAAVLAEMQEAISSRSLASEAFADCIGGFTLGAALGQALDRPPAGDPTRDRMAAYFQSVFLPATTHVMLQNVVNFSSAVDEPGRVHGTARERLSYVEYGMAAGYFYRGAFWARNNQRASVGVFLCAANAYDMQVRHLPGTETPFSPFLGGL